MSRKEAGDPIIPPDLSPPVDSSTSHHADQSPAATETQVPEPDQHSHVQDLVTHVEPRSPEVAKVSASTTPHLSPVSHRDPAATTAPSLMHPITPDRLQALLKALAAVLQASARVQPFRQSTLLVRNELGYEKEASRFKRQYLQQSRREFVDSASKAFVDQTEDAETKNHPSSLSNELRKRHELLIQDESSLESQDQTLHRLEEDLSRKEFTLQTREKTLENATRRAVRVICEMGVVIPGDLELDAVLGLVVRDPSVSSRRQSIAIPSLLDVFRDKAGDANVMYERLMEIELQQRDSRILRGLRQDQGDPMDPSDEEFDEACRQDLDEAIQAHKHAVEVASIARQACIDAGIDPDEHSPVTPMQDEEGPITPDQNMDVPDHHFDRILSSAMLTALTGNLDDEFIDHSTHDEDPALEPVNSHSRVEDWIHEIREVEGGSYHEDFESESFAVPEIHVAEDTTAETSMAGNVSTVPSLQVDRAYSTDQDSAVTPQSHTEVFEILDTGESKESLAASPPSAELTGKRPKTVH